MLNTDLVTFICNLENIKTLVTQTSVFFSMMLFVKFRSCNASSEERFQLLSVFTVLNS